jgi:uncharacterized protein YbjT (DUF2867 family)
VGAAGATGRAVISAVAARGTATVRALIHHKSSVSSVRAAGAGEDAVIELDDVTSLAASFQGLSAIYMIVPLFSQYEVRYVSNALEAAARVGVRRFAYHSVLHPFTPAMRHHERKAAAEVLVRESRLEWVILQPAMYAETMVTMLERAGGRAEIPVPYRTGACFAPVSLRDVATVASHGLNRDDMVYGSFELAGPEVLTAQAMIDQLAEIARRPLVPKEVALNEAAIPSTWGPSSVADAVAMWATYDAHGLLGSPLVLRSLLNREPISFRDAIAARLQAA